MTAAADARATAPPGRQRDAQLGMWLFLVSELLFFGALFMAYAIGRSQHGAGFAAASRHTDLLLGSLNTALLLTSSALAAAAVASAEAPGGSRRAGWQLAAAASLGLLFVGIKAIEYRSEWQQGLFPGPGFALAATDGAELFFMVYFFATALHALHLLAGVALLGSLAWEAGHRRGWASGRRIDAAALYWHFVDIVWIFLFPLLYLVNRQR